MDGLPVKGIDLPRTGQRQIFFLEPHKGGGRGPIVPRQLQGKPVCLVFLVRLKASTSGEVTSEDETTEEEQQREGGHIRQPVEAEMGHRSGISPSRPVVDEVQRRGDQQGRPDDGGQDVMQDEVPHFMRHHKRNLVLVSLESIVSHSTIRLAEPTPVT